MERLLRLPLLFSFAQLGSVCALFLGGHSFPCPRGFWIGTCRSAGVFSSAPCLGRAVVHGLFREVHSSTWRSEWMSF